MLQRRLSVIEKELENERKLNAEMQLRLSNSLADNEGRLKILLSLAQRSTELRKLLAQVQLQQTPSAAVQERQAIPNTTVKESPVDTSLSPLTEVPTQPLPAFAPSPSLSSAVAQSLTRKVRLDPNPVPSSSHSIRVVSRKVESPIPTSYVTQLRSWRDNVQTQGTMKRSSKRQQNIQLHNAQEISIALSNAKGAEDKKKLLDLLESRLRVLEAKRRS